MTHSPSSSRARVVSDATSDPDSGSDIAIASTPPRANRTLELLLLLVGAEAVQRADHDQRHAVAGDRDLPARDLLEEQTALKNSPPEPPYSSSIVSDHQPRSASFFESSSEW